MKKLTLDINERQEQEDYQGMRIIWRDFSIVNLWISLTTDACGYRGPHLKCFLKKVNHSKFPALTQPDHTVSQPLE